MMRFACEKDARFADSTEARALTDAIAALMRFRLVSQKIEREDEAWPPTTA